MVTNKKGFTLIELLVVVAIISLLSSVVLTSLGSARAKARDSVRVQTLQQLRNAFELYYADNKCYPVSFCPEGSSEFSSYYDLSQLSSVYGAVFDLNGDLVDFGYLVAAGGDSSYFVLGTRLETSDQCWFNDINGIRLADCPDQE